MTNIIPSPIIAVSRCIKLNKCSNQGQKIKYTFHFKGYLQKEKIESLLLSVDDQNILLFEPIKKDVDYLLIISVEYILNNILVGKIINAKAINKIMFF